MKKKQQLYNEPYKTLAYLLFVFITVKKKLVNVVILGYKIVAIFHTAMEVTHKLLTELTQRYNTQFGIPSMLWEFLPNFCMRC